MGMFKMNGGHDINIPQQAIDYYNQKTDELLLKLEPFKISPARVNPQSSLSNKYSESIDAKDIESLSMSTMDGYGDRKSMYFEATIGQVGLCGSNYEKCRIIVNELSRKKGFREIISYDFIHDNIFRWFSMKYNGKILNEVNFIQFLTDEASKVIREYSIAIPISNLIIEKPFTVGNITFGYFKKDLFDKIEKKEVEKLKNIDDNKSFDQGMTNLRKKYQGRVTANISLKAEKNRAIEIAKKETDNALVILQLFSPAAFLPKIQNYIGRLGQTLVPESHIFIFNNELPEINQGVENRKSNLWRIDEEVLSMMDESGLEVFNDLIIKTEPSPFEVTCFTAIKYFTKAISSKENHDKLVYAIVSIETLLLRDKIERLQENTIPRLIVLNGGKNYQKEITSLMTKAYHYRSSYLHHGEKGPILDILKNLQSKIWTSIKKAVKLVSKFENSLEFIDYLEEEIRMQNIERYKKPVED
jgi:hypothetical protein